MPRRQQRPKTLVVQTLDGSTFYAVGKAIGPEPTAFTITDEPKKQVDIRPSEADVIRALVKTVTTTAGVAKMRIGTATPEAVEMRELKAALADAQGENEQLKRELADARFQIDDLGALRSALDGANAQVEALSGELALAEAQVEDTGKQLTAANAQIESLSEQLLAAKAEIDKLRQEAA
ncbi:MAG: hypothetical protein AAGC55_01065 [Myxococcota bacterium]